MLPSFMLKLVQAGCRGVKKNSNICLGQMMQDLLAGFQMRAEILRPCDPESRSKRVQSESGAVGRSGLSN